MTTSNKTDNGAPSFLDLPRDLRDEVYAMLYPKRMVVSVGGYYETMKPSDHGHFTIDLRFPEDFRGRCMLRVAKHVRVEALEYVHKRCVLVVDCFSNPYANQPLVREYSTGRFTANNPLPLCVYQGMTRFEIASCHGFQWASETREFEVEHHLMTLRLRFEMRRTSPSSQICVQTTHSWEDLPHLRPEDTPSNQIVQRSRRLIEAFVGARVSYIVPTSAEISNTRTPRGAMINSRLAVSSTYPNAQLFWLLQQACIFKIGSKTGAAPNGLSHLFITASRARSNYLSNPNYGLYDMRNDGGQQLEPLHDWDAVVDFKEVSQIPSAGHDTVRFYEDLVLGRVVAPDRDRWIGSGETINSGLVLGEHVLRACGTQKRAPTLAQANAPSYPMTAPNTAALPMSAYPFLPITISEHTAADGTRFYIINSKDEARERERDEYQNHFPGIFHRIPDPAPSKTNLWIDLSRDYSLCYAPGKRT
ncbi:Hypothetical predicted protein [Lecanosticta acicola]|uniref:Uncharacterized protein n=1 Tax=Lecanosticta acicola TaxID=111012 RepID=A0AAI9EAN8_9PEZI|nr:Hypothetical predicted protein [Lecanosticta acicola]